MISNNEIQRFQNLDLQTIEGIADEKLRKQALKLKNKQGGFTLLELLVVVAILAVLGGLAIGAYGDKTAVAAKGGATNTLASLNEVIQTFQATTKLLPNNLDSLVCAVPAAAAMTIAAPTAAYGGTSDLAGVGGGITAKLAGKFKLNTVPNDLLSAFNNAGINQFRYGYVKDATDSSCDTLGTGDIAAPALVADVDFGAGFGVAGATVYPNGSLAEIDIPLRGFDLPKGAGGNRGRAYVKSTLTAGTGDFQAAVTLPLQIWKPGANGFNNLKVGGQKTDVLVGLGIGNNAASGELASSIPFYGDVPKDKYNRYIGLFKVGTDSDFDGDLTTGTVTAASSAKFISIIDSKGDFLDEEYAEASGQS